MKTKTIDLLKNFKGSEIKKENLKVITGGYVRLTAHSTGGRSDVDFEEFDPNEGPPGC